MFLSPSRMVWQQCQVLCPRGRYRCGTSAPAQAAEGQTPSFLPSFAGLAAGNPIASQAGCPAWDDGAGCAGSHSRSADKRQEANTSLPSWAPAGACGHSGLPGPSAPQATNPLLLRSGQLQPSLDLVRNQRKSNRTFYGCLPVIVFWKDADF